MSFIVVQYVVFFVLLVLLASVVGNGIYKVMAGKKMLLTRILAPMEQAVYRLIGVDEEEQMDAKSYALAVVQFSLAGFAGLWMLLMLQGFLPLNPEGKAGMSWDLALNTAASFITNTNWQAYAGEVSLSYLSQMLGLTVQNFLSAAVGLAVLFAVIRGLVLKESEAIGNFWKDLTRAVLYILLPLATVLAVLLASQGVIQTFQGAQQATALESGELFSISLGPVASQAAIKVLGTNGGGFFGTNAAYPLENPTALSNVLQMLSILLIPVSLLFTFGKAVKDRLHARALFITMAALFVGLLALVTYSEWSLGPIFEGVQARRKHGRERSDPWNWRIGAVDCSNYGDFYGSDQFQLVQLYRIGKPSALVLDAVRRNRLRRHRLRYLWDAGLCVADCIHSGIDGRTDAGISGQESRTIRYEDGECYHLDAFTVEFDRHGCRHYAADDH